jgi:hypothetical protein
MPGCLSRCTSYSTASIQEAWEDIRDHYGPKVGWSTVSGSLAQDDVTEWTEWAVANGVDPVSNISKFGQWLIWKCSYGTANYGNLPTRLRDHVGITCIPCPYDIEERSDSVRTELWTGSDSVDREDHTAGGKIHYMRVSLRGNKWGFECTYSGCPYQDAAGYPYFYA